jgi:hypothetical protein
LKLLASQHIDKRKWDQMVASDAHLDFFSLSWVFDVLHPNWEMLCDDEGNYIMIIPHASKFGLTYRLQPFFIRSLQFSIGNQVKSLDIIQYLKNSAPYIHLNFDSDDQGVFQSFGIFQLLDLSPSIDVVKSHYGTNAKRILKKIPSDFIFDQHIEIDEFISFFKKQKGEELVGFTADVWMRLAHLLRETNQRGMLTIQTIHSDGLLIAAGAFISYKGTCYFLKGTATPDGKKTGAMYALLDRVITAVHSSHHRFDFVGSNNEAIAQFYRKFGAQDKHYGILKQNNLPAILRIFKA